MRPWTIDFHVAQNDDTVKGAGSHDKTGRHYPSFRSQRESWTSFAMRATGCATTAGRLPARSNTSRWDGCMFPNSVMMDPKTWRDILATMIAVWATRTAGQ